MTPIVKPAHKCTPALEVLALLVALSIVALSSSASIIASSIYGTVSENNYLTLRCPSGAVSAIVFASFGTPVDHGGGNFSVAHSCNSNTSVSVVENNCIGQQTCRVLASTSVFKLEVNDSCNSTSKHLSVVATCSSHLYGPGCQITANSWNHNLPNFPNACGVFINGILVSPPSNLYPGYTSGAYITQIVINSDGSCNPTTLVQGPQPVYEASLASENIINSLGNMTAGSVGIFSTCDNLNGISNEAISALASTFHTSTTDFTNYRQSYSVITKIGDVRAPICEQSPSSAATSLSCTLASANATAPTTPLIYGTARENDNLELTCPALTGTVFVNVVFASFGLPFENGAGTFNVNPICHASTSVSAVDAFCLGKSSCSIPATVSFFSDQCYGSRKRLFVSLICGQKVPIVSRSFVSPVYKTGNFTVPAGVYTMYVDAKGGVGGDSPSGRAGGKGGRVQDFLPVLPGQYLILVIGGAGLRQYWYLGPPITPKVYTVTNDNRGYNGGAWSDVGGGGGGVTQLFREGTLLLASGGGGGGGSTDGGAGGGLIGATAALGSSAQFPAKGGSQSSPGSGAFCNLALGNCKLNYYYTYCDASSAQGAQGGQSSCYTYSGGGGGGYFGGGGGLSSGGGGGSSYSTGYSTIHTQGYSSGPGNMTIRFAACPNGTFTDLNSFFKATVATCTLCPLTTFAYGGAFACSPAGSFVYPGSNRVQPCAPGSYAFAGQSICTLCAPGTFNPQGMATAPSACQACLPGYACPLGSPNPVPCGPGSYAPSPGSAPVCTQCSVGTANNNSMSILASDCLVCPTGYVAPVGSATCQLCPAGKYVPAGARASTCTSCSTNTYADTAGSTACTPCPPNSQATVGSAATCVCNTGYSRSGYGRTLVCSICDENTFSPRQICPPGFTYSLTYSGCYAFIGIEADWFNATAHCQNMEPKTGALVKINNANENQVIRFIAHSTDEIWLGLNSLKANGAQRWNAETSGPSYFNWIGDSRVNLYYSTTKLCDFMYIAQDGYVWNAYWGTWNSDVCSNQRAYVCEASVISDNYCQRCPFMAVSAVGSGVCLCVPGYSQSGGTASQIQCTVCPSGTFNPSYASPMCSDCPAGKFSSAGATSCTPCPANTFSFRSGATRVEDCQECPWSYVAQPGSSACELCNDAVNAQFVKADSFAISLTEDWL